MGTAPSGEGPDDPLLHLQRTVLGDTAGPGLRAGKRSQPWLLKRAWPEGSSATG